MALDNFIPKNNMAECNRCKKFRRETVTCEKYQRRISKEKPVGLCPDLEEEPGPLYTPEMFEFMKALVGENPERLKKLQEEMRPDYRMYGEKGPEA